MAEHSVTEGSPARGPQRSWIRMFIRTAGLRVAVLPISALCALTTAGLTVHYAGVLAFGFITLIAQLQLALHFADLGMGAAVARAVARADGSARAAKQVRILIRRTALLLLTVGLLGATGAALSGLYGFWSRVFEVPAALAPQVDLVMSLVLVVFFLSLPLGIAERVLVGRDRSDVLVLLGLLPSAGNLLVVLSLGELGVPVAWLALGLPLSTVGFLAVCGYLAFLHPRVGIRGLSVSEDPSEAGSHVAEPDESEPHGAEPDGAEPHGPRTEAVEGTSVRLILLGGLPVLLATAGTLLAEQHGRVVLASAATALDLSEYAIALQLYMPIYSVLFMAAAVLWPRFAVDPSPGLWRQANLMLTGLGICAALGFVIFARPVAGLVSGGDLVPSWGVVLGLGAALVAQSAHLTQMNLFTDRPGFWRQAAMSMTMLVLVVPGTLLGIQLGLGAAAPGISMALGVTLAQVIPGLLMAARQVRRPDIGATAPTAATNPVPTPTPAPQASPRKVITMHPSFRRLLTPIPDPVLRQIMYRRKFGRWGNFSSPSRFTEFLTRRMLQDRSPEIAWTCDKRAMKDYAAERTPWINVPETLWHGTDLSELDLSRLPDQWVLKPNHRSKAVYMGDRSTTLEDLHRATKGWLLPYDRIAVGEWAYGQARRELIIEPRIGDGATLTDFKMFVFHGVMRILHTNTGRFTEHFQELFYNRDWEPLDITNQASQGPVDPRPKNYGEMVRAAEILGAGYDFMRVDLYNLDGELWFGELTPYPSGGMDPFCPELVDIQMGAWWAGRDAVRQVSDGLPRLIPSSGVGAPSDPGLLADTGRLTLPEENKRALP